MLCFIFVFLLAAPEFAISREVRLILAPDMAVNESKAGEPGLLFDEQERAGDPPFYETSAGWSAYKNFPQHAYVDFGTTRSLTRVFIYDTNGVGDFVVSAGAPGAWTPLFTEKCDAYKKWKEHPATARTRYLQFTRMSGGANVAEVVIYAEAGDIPVAIVSKNVTRGGGNDASAAAAPQTGTPPYSFRWSNGQKTASIAGLTSGTYTVEVVDAAGRWGQADVVIAEPSPLKVSYSVQNAAPSARDGRIELSAKGGVAPYAYAWSTGATGSEISGLAAGAYQATVTDQSGQTARATVSVLEQKPDALFPEMKTVDEVVWGEAANESAHLFQEYPNGVSRVENILGRACRVLPNTKSGMKLFAVRLGRGKNLVPGRGYVLEVEYPEDEPRAMFILNRGAETQRGFHTGAAVGDALHTPYVGSNPESLRYPLSGKIMTWRSLFFLHDRFPDVSQPRGELARPFTSGDGFWVIIAQFAGAQDPLSKGAAVARIRLCEAPELANYSLKINFPPDGLPRRHLFFREEMADGVVQSRKVAERGVTDDTAWFEYKARLMKFLGMNTYCKDLLEFGHNQGWDTRPYGGSWINTPPVSDRWANILAMVGQYDLTVMPYYEYAGSIGPDGLGQQRRCMTLGGKKVYTHISWSEKANADITDPDTLADAKKILECTVVRYKDLVNFTGVWFRNRPSHIPISFSDRCLALFASETKAGAAPTREALAKDKALLEKYYEWWYGKRTAFLRGLRDYLRESGVNKEAVVLYTTDTSEPGAWKYEYQGPTVVTDDADTWSALGEKPILLKQTLDERRHLKALTELHFNWGDWEWQHSCPAAHPESYRNEDGLLPTYSFNKAYTVSFPEGFDAFRTPSGLAAIRHYCLNENAMDGGTTGPLGYFVSDMELAGPYCMLGEARAMAYGDPRYIGYLASSSFNRGFPEYVRAFNRAFLSLPALPSEILKGACNDSEVVVRAIKTPTQGTYLAVINTGLKEKTNVEIALPSPGKVINAATGQPLSAANGKASLALYPCEMKSLRVMP
ncbi:MAG: SprB repeat-containing protein [Candidatus Sumerlaeota bacterium]|nr:SprB repeat-containing protein [Candidatus Sumerlaeota bacterium]